MLPAQSVTAGVPPDSQDDTSHRPFCDNRQLFPCPKPPNAHTALPASFSVASIQQTPRLIRMLRACSWLPTGPRARTHLLSTAHRALPSGLSDIFVHKCLRYHLFLNLGGHRPL